MDELRQLANDVAFKVNEIIAGNLKPFDKDLHIWATSRLALLDNISHEDQKLADVIEDNLVNILSCDNATWDTSEAGFKNSLDELKLLL
jgi:hypothetical protein